MKLTETTITLTAARLSAGLSVEDVAKMLKTSPARIERIEAGEEWPTLRQIDVMQDVYLLTDVGMGCALLNTQRGKK